MHPVSASMMVWASSRRTCPGREVSVSHSSARFASVYAPLRRTAGWGVRVAFAPPGLLVVRRGVFALPQRS